MDDLLPRSDDAFEPVESGEYFNRGSDFWEVADLYKWQRPLDTFAAGYRAAFFECALKSGRAFAFMTHKSEGLKPYIQRAEEYHRQIAVQETSSEVDFVHISVSAHESR